MFLVIGISFVPLFGFAIFGLFLVLFPNAFLNLQNYNASMKGRLFDNSLEFRDSAVVLTKISGVVFILIGVGIFLLINGWLDFLIY